MTRVRTHAPDPEHPPGTSLYGVTALCRFNHYGWVYASEGHDPSCGHCRRALGLCPVGHKPLGSEDIESLCSLPDRHEGLCNMVPIEVPPA